MRVVLESRLHYESTRLFFTHPYRRRIPLPIHLFTNFIRLVSAKNTITRIQHLWNSLRHINERLGSAWDTAAVFCANMCKSLHFRAPLIKYIYQFNNSPNLSLLCLLLQIRIEARARISLLTVNQMLLIRVFSFLLRVNYNHSLRYTK